jgi:hypothetical protein
MRAKRRRQSKRIIKYPGELNTPLEPRSDLFLTELPSVNPDDDDIPPPISYYASIGGTIDIDRYLFELMWRPEFDRKFDLLFGHYSISRDDPNKWGRLALALAEAHVPGFQEKEAKMRGRPKAWSGAREFNLWQQFRKRVEGGQSERNAAAIMAKKLNASRPGSNVTGAALLRRLQRFEEHLRASGDLAIFDPKRG